MTIQERITTGWNFTRFLFLAIGILYFVSSLVDGMWLGAILSLIFIVQAIFGIGCCGGNCPGGNCNIQDK